VSKADNIGKGVTTDYVEGTYPKSEAYYERHDGALFIHPAPSFDVTD
jgi:hypothetical protein